MSGLTGMMRLGVVDAANNCEREGAQATLTLRSGVQITGKLNRPGTADGDHTLHVSMPGGGWVTLLAEEVVAVESHR